MLFEIFVVLIIPETDNIISSYLRTNGEARIGFWKKGLKTEKSGEYGITPSKNNGALPWKFGELLRL